MSNSDPLTILFPLYPGVTELDFTGPYHSFVLLPGVKPIVASVEGKPVTLEGLNFSGLVPLEQIERCDVLCVPGGRVAPTLSESRAIYLRSGRWRRLLAISLRFAQA